MIRYLNSLWCEWFWGYHWWTALTTIDESVRYAWKDGRAEYYYIYTCLRCGSRSEEPR